MILIDKLMKKMGWVRYHEPAPEGSYFGVTISWLNDKEEVLAEYYPNAAMLIGDSIAVDVLPKMSIERLGNGGKVRLDEKVESDIEAAYKVSVDEFLKKIKYIRFGTKVR